VREIEVRAFAPGASGSDSAVEPERIYRALTTTADGIVIYENRKVLPRFRFVRNVKHAKDLTDAIRQLNDPDFDPADEAIVEGISTDDTVSQGRIVSEKLGATSMQWSVEAPGRSCFVVADSYFTGWTATVDDKEVPIYPVYGFVRGLLIDSPGRHKIVMSFHAPGLYASIGMTVSGVLIVLLCALELKGRLKVNSESGASWDNRV
jgi:hypothetical protein